jgi:hypothetical protein
MKKIFFVLMLLPALCFGQTIIDQPNSIKIIQPKDTVVLKKENIISVQITDDGVYLLANAKENIAFRSVSFELKYRDFSTQFASNAKMHEFLSTAFTKEYTLVNYHWTGANMDTASYVIGADTVYQLIHIFSGDKVITKKYEY